MKRVLWLLLVGGLIATALAAARAWTRRLTGSDIQGGMADLAEAAVAMAKADQGLALDYSPSSVEQVERALATVYERSPKEALSHEERTFLAVRYGAYIGEVVRRKWGGRWERDHPVAGPGSFPMDSQGHQSFPIGWCYKRLTNGAEDNVWHKFQALYLKDAS